MSHRACTGSLVLSLVIAAAAAAEDVPDTLAFDDKSFPLRLVHITLSPNGRGEVQLISGSVQLTGDTWPIDQHEAPPAQVARLPGARTQQRNDGGISIFYDFAAKPDHAMLEAYTGGGFGPAGLVLAAPKTDTRAGWGPGRTIRLPASVTIAMDGLSEDLLVEFSRATDALGVRLTAESEQALRVQAFWRQPNAQKPGEVATTPLLMYTQSLQPGVPQAFTAPHQFAASERFWVDVYRQSQAPQSIRTLRVEAASLAPYWGVGLQNDGGKIVVSQVLDGAAKRAGLRVGDIIVALDGKPAESFADALRMMGEGNAGRTLVWTVRRGDKTAKVRIVSE